MLLSLMGGKTVSAVLALDLDFTGGSLPSGATLTRSSTGTYFDSDGVMQTAADDTPRFDYDPSTLALKGLLIEPQATNYIEYSDFSSSWNSPNVTSTVSSESLPDNVTLARSLVPYSSEPYVNYTAYWMATGSYTASVLAKPNSWDYLNFRGMLASSYLNRSVRLSTNEVVSAGSFGTGKIVSVGTGGWKRASTSFTRTSGTSTITIDPLNFAIASDSAPIPSSYDGTGILVGMFQLESGLTATSFIPTSGSASATRAADVLQLTIPSACTLRFTFDDGTTQDFAASAGTFTVDPTAISRPWVKTIQSV